MNRTAETAGRRGIALIATLVLLIFLAAMIATVLQGDVAQRRQVRLRRSQNIALALAESGVAEAIRAIARQSGENKIESGVSADRKFQVEWHEAQGGAGAYEIRSIGINDSDALVSAHRVVRVRAEVPPGQPARILSWTESAR
jgi:type II secretory pathway pseudopilin PulG